MNGSRGNLTLPEGNTILPISVYKTEYTSAWGSTAEIIITAKVLLPYSEVEKLAASLFRDNVTLVVNKKTDE